MDLESRLSEAEKEAHTGEIFFFVSFGITSLKVYRFNDFFFKSRGCYGCLSGKIGENVQLWCNTYG